MATPSKPGAKDTVTDTDTDTNVFRQKIIAQKREKKDKNKKKKMYVKEGVSVDDLRQGWIQCVFFIKKKKRLCNMQRASQSMFCPVHRSDVAALSGEDGVNTDGSIGAAIASSNTTQEDNISTETEPGATKNVHTTINEEHIRVPCPIEPTHSVYKHKLAEHLKKCNTKTRYQKLEEFDYYCKDCNTGRNLVDTTPSTVDPNELLQKVEALYESIKHDIRPLRESDLAAVVLPEDRMLAALSGEKCSYGKVRHGLQDVLLVKALVLAGLLTATPTHSSTTSNSTTSTSNSNRNSSRERETEPTEEEEEEAPAPAAAAPPAASSGNGVTTFIELGAGKGLLGLAIASSQQHQQHQQQSGGGSSRAEGADSRTQLVMVERSGSKKTGDRALDALGFSAHTRVRMDLRDCVLPRLPGVGRGSGE
jgi:hypothetical protein